MRISPKFSKIGVPALTLPLGFGLALALFTSLQPTTAYTEELFMMKDAQGTALFTTSPQAADDAVQNGYTVDQTYEVPVSGEAEVHELYNAQTSDQLTVADENGTIQNLTSKQGYTDRGVQFHAATAKTNYYSTPIYRYQRQGRHAYGSSSDADAMQKTGWRQERVEFWVHQKNPVASSTSSAQASSPANTTAAASPSASTQTTNQPTAAATQTAAASQSAATPQSPTTGSTANDSDSTPGVTNTSATGAGTVPATAIDYSHAVFVAPASSARTASAKLGSQANPYTSVSAAIKAAPKYSTVVLRAGVYHESITLENKYLNVVGYPGEQVIFDGAETFSNWSKSGSVWATDWKYDFNHDVTFTKGAPNGTSPSVNWLDDDAPYAYLPEQVWIDGQAQAQVGAKSELAAGKFYVDNNANKLYLGSNPSGHKVTISTLQRAFMIWNGSAPKQRLRVENLTFRNYSPSNPQLAAGLFYTQNYDLINTTFQNTSVSAVGVYADNVHLNGLTIENSGLLGVAANEVSGVSIKNSTITNFNTQRFSSAPVSGAVKITTSDNILIQHNMISNTTPNPKGKGIWLDESCENATVDNNTIKNVQEDAIYAEVSNNITISHNTISEVPIDGIRIGNTSNATVRSNNVTAGERAYYAWQENRYPSADSYYAMDARDGIKPGSPKWDSYLASYMSWRIEHLVIENNLFTTTVTDTTRPTVGIMADTDSGVSVDGRAAIDSLQNNTIKNANPRALAIAVAGARNPKIYEASFEIR